MSIVWSRKGRPALICSLTLAALAAGHAQSRPPTDRDYITGTPQGVAILAAEDARAATPEQLATLLEGARSSVEELKLAAVRALGRLERREIVSSLLPYLRDTRPAVRSEAAHAIGQAMQGPPLAGDAGVRQVDATLSVLLQVTRAETVPSVLEPLARTLARLPYDSPEQVQRVETLFNAMIARSSELAVDRGRPGTQAVVAGAATAAFEVLFRTERTAFEPSDETARVLRGIASGTGGTPVGADVIRAVRQPAFRAVVTGRLLDAETLRPNLSYDADPWLRYLATLALAGGGSPIAGEERVALLQAALRDKTAAVRYEAVRGYARHGAASEGCVPLTGMLADPSPHVVLATIDALGDVCRDDDSVTLRLVAEARTPPEQGPWQRESHALVALAKRAPDRIEIPLQAHARHNRWQVRMYAARAAAAANDAATLERFAADEHDNVREAALVPIKRLKGQESEAVFAAALARQDYQLLRTAARELVELRPTQPLTAALVDALLRVTAERRETSRDTRLALLERLRDYGNERYLERLRPLLRDFDPRIASAAAATMTAWTGEHYAIDPQPLPRDPLPQPSELKLVGENVAVLLMESGSELVLRLDPVLAPMTSVRFLRLVNQNYFDGLTFHRVVPNFVVQGGSPGANEYMGDALYLRDEISRQTHARGTVGLSTRGRDTGDAQFFINLVGNPRLDFNYTVFGRVSPRSEGIIDEIVEGDRIKDVWFEKAR